VSTEPEISVVIPTHNRPQMLETTLRTVLWQRDVDLEVIVVDDGSREELRPDPEQLTDPRVRLIRNERAQGVSTARNRGAAEARAPWLAFCDDDDLWAPEKLVRQLAAAQATDRSWAYGGSVHVNAELRLLNAVRPPSAEELVSALPRWSLMPGGSSNAIVRAETFAQVGRWEPTLINLADWDLWARLAQLDVPACVDEPLVGYRVHPGNASGDTELILREARVLDGRFGMRMDYARLQHYLAWVYLRSGQRRAAVRHFARAAAGGQAKAVYADLANIGRHRVARVFPLLQPTPDAVQESWLAATETWVARLRDAAVQRG
jgi:glycosyltransferase involved in cell wall biosynthesis